MRLLMHLFAFIHGVVALLFTMAAGALIVIAFRVAWVALQADGFGKDAAQEVIEAIGYLAAAVLALQMSQTIAEEEIVRGANVSGPTRVRRFLSRFFVVIVVALAIEGLVAVFKAVHEDMERLMYAGAVLAATGVLLAAWGVFVRLNRAAEELEPEAMQRAKQEDRKFEEVTEGSAS
ncbi:hypothetical protein [Ramlibacter rhizophilus]|uniref:Uncharacterized protein n=1 Tax=Ramlibacter rhizophilus TaxID=1781167 RepID=A0A4Z0BPA0_9BURK|nr:hypothetical protein [Ramlibacter rhizophilus]TFZ01137.1 hypothetical protein EZ242_07020 [Ramlibacter rhizophilus]